MELHLFSWGVHNDLQDGMDVYIEPGTSVQFTLVGKRHATIDKIINSGHTWYTNYLYNSTNETGELCFTMTLERSGYSEVPSVGTNFDLKYQSSSSQTKITGTPAVMVSGSSNILREAATVPYIELNHGNLEY